MKILAMVATLLAATAGQAMAGVVLSTNTADFNLTFVGFADSGAVATPLVSTDGSLTLKSALIGDPAAGDQYYQDFTAALSDSEYALDGDENFDITFTTGQNAFAMNYLDESISSTFTLDFFDGMTGVGSTSFTTSSFGTAQFIGFTSSLSFDKITVREDDGPGNSNEYFQFYRATSATAAVPEPASITMFALGALGMMFARRRRQQMKPAA